MATAQERAGQIRGATMEISSIMEEFQMQAMGGLMSAWEPWEKALIPSLLSSCVTWFGKCQTTVDIWHDLQNFYCREMLTVPESGPKIAFICEIRMICMKWRIWQEKILLLIRIKNHESEVLCKQVYEEGKKR